MTQKDKELLLKDLCARVPYGVEIICESSNINLTLTPHMLEGIFKDNNKLEWKPYLFHLSSMTEEQKYTCPIGVANLEIFIKNESWTYLELTPDSILRFVDWLNKNHFDYRGLIDKGLAIDATGLNIY